MAGAWNANEVASTDIQQLLIQSNCNYVSKAFTSTPGKVQYVGFYAHQDTQYEIDIQLTTDTSWHLRVVPLGQEIGDIQYNILWGSGSVNAVVSSENSGFVYFYSEIQSVAQSIYISIKQPNFKQLGNADNPITQSVVTEAICNMLSSSGTGLHWEETITAGQEGNVVYGSIKKGVHYRCNIVDKETSEVLSINVRGISRTGETVDAAMYLNSMFCFDTDVYAIKIYYGLTNTTGSTASVTIDKEDVFLSNEYSYRHNSIFPFNTAVPYSTDSRITIDATSNVIYENGKTIIPVGGSWIAYIELAKFGINGQSVNKTLQVLVQATNITQTPGSRISIDVDSVNSGEYNQAHNLYKCKSDVYVRLTKLNYESKSGRIRLCINNMAGTDNVEVGFIYAWLEPQEEHTTAGLVSSFVNRLQQVSSLCPIFNICPKISQFNLNTGNLRITGDRSFTFTGTTTSSVIGFNFLCSKQQGVQQYQDFSIYFETGNIQRTGNIWLHIIYYDIDGTEISRTSLTNFDANSVCKLASDIPENTHHIIVRFQVSAIDDSFEINNIIIVHGVSTSDVYFLKNVVSDIKTIQVGLTDITTDNEKLSIVYVDEANGDDNYSGIALESAFKTFEKAFSVIADNATIVLRGDIHQRFNIKTNSTQQSLRLIGVSGQLNRIIGGKAINSATLVEGNVYSVQLDSFNTDEQFKLFQHEAADENTLITDTDRHPLQRGKQYRCESSMLVRKTSLNDVQTASELSFYYDEDSKLLYFKIKAGTNLTDNPIYIPAGSANVYGNDGTVKFEMSGIESWYAAISVTKCHNGKISDCAAKYAYGNGAFSMGNSIGLELIRCEAARAFSGTTTGDGFNAHSDTGSINTASKRTSFTMIDCWSHDNNDDGYSDHEGCEVTIIGGLFENNVKGGLTPSYGAHDKYIGCYVRNNTNGGIYHVGQTSDGGIGGQTECFDCVSEGNSWNYGVANGTSDQPNKLILVNCISINGDYGFRAFSNYNFIELINCYDNGSSTVKGGVTQNITVKNASLVE